MSQATTQDTSFMTLDTPLLPAIITENTWMNRVTYAPTSENTFLKAKKFKEKFHAYIYMFYVHVESFVKKQLFFA